MMITGDYHHTAIAVAKGVGMVQPGSDIVVIDTIGEPQLRSERSALATPHSVASRVATPNFTPQASFSAHGGRAFRDSPLQQQQEEQQMLFAAFEKADPDHAFEPELLGSQQSGKHKHWDFQKSDLDYASAPQSQEKQSQGKHQHWQDDQTMLEPVYGNMQSIQDTAAPSGGMGHTQQGALALRGNKSMRVQSASQLQGPAQAAPLSHQAADSRQQSAVSRQKSAVSQQQSAVSRQQLAVSWQQPGPGSQQQSAVSHQAAVSRQQSAVSWQQSAVSWQLPGGLQQQFAVSWQQSAVSRQQSAVSWDQSAVSWQQSAVSRQQSAVSWDQSAVSGQQSAVSQHLHRKLSPLTGAEKMRLKLSGQLQIPAEAPSQQQQQHEHQHLVGLEMTQASGSIATASLLHAAVADKPSLHQRQIPQSDDQSPITVVSRRKSWFMSMLEKFAEDEAAPQQTQHEEETASQELSVRESSLPVILRLKSRLSGLFQMHTEEEEASRHQGGEGQMQKGPPPVTGLARMRSILAGHLQLPDLDTPLSDPPMFSPRGRPANPLSIFIPPAAPEPSWEGLRFLTAGHQTLEASQALTALAEGHMRCAVTGDAFEHLLQHHDLSLLELVMRNVAVFSRMQPQQKGQVMDLLGIQGIHQLFNGRPRHIVVSTHPVTVSYSDSLPR